jgi:hypothetical protein
MNVVVLALSLVVPAQDTTPASQDSSPPVAQAPDYAPTLRNTALLSGLVAFDPSSTVLAPPLDESARASPEGTVGDSVRRRPKAVEYSDLYYTRLKIHQIASYLTVPLFVAQYLAGRELWNHPDSHGLAKDAHGPLAAGIAGLFAVNTVTGVWNLWEGRKDPHGRARRWVHGLTMIAADAGFVVVGATAPGDDFRENGGTGRGSGASTHRDVAIGSMGLALGSYLMMLIWKD